MVAGLILCPKKAIAASSSTPAQGNKVPEEDLELLAHEFLKPFRVPQHKSTIHLRRLGEPVAIPFEPDCSVHPAGGMVVELEADDVGFFLQGNGLHLAVGGGHQNLEMFRKRSQHGLAVPLEEGKGVGN